MNVAVSAVAIVDAFIVVSTTSIFDISECASGLVL